MKQKITAGGTLLTALLLGVGPWTFFKACPVTPEKIMKCHWCCLALIPLALVLGAAGIVQLMAKSREARQAVCLLAAAAYIGTILLPAVLIGGCAKPEMACNVLTYPCVYAVSALGLVFQAAGLFIGKNGKHV